MITADIKQLKIAKTYSKALLQSAQEQNLADKVLEDLLFIQELIHTNAQLSDVLKNPVIRLEDKKDIINRLLENRIDKITLDFLLLLLENNRINAFDESLNQYIYAYNKLNNVATPVITSAVELDEIQKSRITEKLNQKLSKTIAPKYIINPDIIGGLIIEIDDNTLDFSLKYKFDNMKKELTKGNRYGND